MQQGHEGHMHAFVVIAGTPSPTGPMTTQCIALSELQDRFYSTRAVTEVTEHTRARTKKPSEKRRAPFAGTGVYYSSIAGSAVPSNASPNFIQYITTNKVQFAVLSRYEILQRLSVLEINDVKLLNDERLGGTSRAACRTCSLDYKGCPGHMGHIMLPQCMYNPLFITHVVRVVNFMCILCRRHLLSPNILRVMFPLPRRSPASITTHLRTIQLFLQRQSHCMHCGRKRSVVRNIGLQMYISNPQLPCEIPLSSLSVYTLLIEVPDADYVALGLDPINNHPVKMLLSVLPVLPPVARPSSQNTVGMVIMVKVLPWVVVGAGGLGAGKTSGAGTRGVFLDVVIGGRTRDTDTNGGESSDNRSKVHADCGPAENPSL